MSSVTTLSSQNVAISSPAGVPPNPSKITWSDFFSSPLVTNAVKTALKNAKERAELAANISPEVPLEQHPFKKAKFSALELAAKQAVTENEDQLTSLKKNKTTLIITGCVAVALAIAVAVAAVFLWPLTIATLSILAAASVASIALASFTAIGTVNYQKNKSSMESDLDFHTNLAKSQDFKKYVIEKFFVSEDQPIDADTCINKNTGMSLYIRRNKEALKQAFADFTAQQQAQAKE